MKILLAARIMVMSGFALLLVSCGNNDNFPKYNTLQDLRILTVVADQPEVSPGDTVTFTPVLSDISGQGRTISYSVYGCIDPGIGVGATPACLNPDPASMQTGTVTIAPGSSLTYTGPVAPFSLTMPSEQVIFASRSTADQYNGVAYLVFYSISIPNGPSIDSFLRVMVSSASKTGKNQNPVISSIDLNDSPITGIIPIPGAAVNFRATSPASSAETYQIMQNDGTFITKTEELINTWFVSDGTFDSMRTIGNSEDQWSPPASNPGGRGMVLLVVTRDGRGGAAFQKVEFN